MCVQCHAKHPHDWDNVEQYHTHEHPKCSIFLIIISINIFMSMNLQSVIVGMNIQRNIISMNIIISINMSSNIGMNMTSNLCMNIFMSIEHGHEQVVQFWRFPDFLPLLYSNRPVPGERKELRATFLFTKENIKVD